jgi:hypothetical protein
MLNSIPHPHPADQRRSSGRGGGPGPWRWKYEHLATHGREQVFHVDSNGLLRRHDYTPEVINAGPAAHYPSEYKEFDGILVPTRRRVYRRGPDGSVSRDVGLVIIDVESVLFI